MKLHDGDKICWFKKALKIATATAVVLTIAACGNDSKNETSKAKDEKTEKTEQAEKEKKEVNNNHGISKDKIEKVNQKIKKMLDEDHQYAKNGDKAYAYSFMIYDMAMQDDGRVVIQIDENFMKVSEDERNSVATRLKNRVMFILMSEGVPEDKAKDPFLSFRSGPQILGNSKMTDASKIKWKKIK